MLSTKFQFIWESGFRGEDFYQKSTNQKQEWPVVAMFVIGSELNEQSLQLTFQGCFLPRFDSFGHAVSEEKIFQKSANQKMWRPCLLTDRDKMSNLYRGPSINASYQVSVHLAEGFQRKRLKCEKLTDDRRRTTEDVKPVTYNMLYHWLFNSNKDTRNCVLNQLIY